MIRRCHMASGKNCTKAPDHLNERTLMRREGGAVTSVTTGSKAAYFSQRTQEKGNEIACVEGSNFSSKVHATIHSAQEI